jgi:hypothetical protein
MGHAVAARAQFNTSHFAITTNGKAAQQRSACESGSPSELPSGITHLS